MTANAGYNAGRPETSQTSVNRSRAAPPRALVPHRSAREADPPAGAGEWEAPGRFKVIVNDKTGDEATTASIIENIQRKDLSAKEFGIACLNLMKATGWNQKTLTEKLHKSKSYISEAVSYAKKFDASNSKENTNSALKNNKTKPEQLSFNFRWKLSDKIKTKLSKTQMSNIEKKVTQMEKLKNEIGEIIETIK